MGHQENQEMPKNLHQALQPMVLWLQDEETREYTLSALTYYLRQLVANQEAEMYSLTGRFLYYSHGTIGILKEEVTRYIAMLEALILSPRSCRRLMHVPDIFKCMVASDMARPHFVMNGYCDHLPLMIAFFHTRVPEGIREDIREGALAVVELLCRARDARIVWWILEKRVIDCIEVGMTLGGESSKLLGTQILEVLLEDFVAAHYVCTYKPLLLPSLNSFWDHMPYVKTFSAFSGRISPQLLLHIFRCYRRLCLIPKGLETLQKQNVSLNMMRTDSHIIRQNYLEIITLLDQVLYFMKFSMRDS